MASGTRSGRNREENHLSRVKRKDGKSTLFYGSEMNGSCSGKVGDRKHNKSSTSSGSISTASWKLRRTPMKINEKLEVCNAGTRRSERLEKPCQSSPSSNSKLGHLDPKTTISLRRSERIEKIGISSSPSYKKSGNSLSSDLNVRNRENESRKTRTVDSKKDNDDTLARGSPKQRTFMNARSYRKSLLMNLTEGLGVNTSKKHQGSIKKEDKNSAEMPEPEDAGASVESSNLGSIVFCENGNLDAAFHKKKKRKSACELTDAKTISQLEEHNYLPLSPSEKNFEVDVGYEIKRGRSKSSKAENSIHEDSILIANADLDGDLVDGTVRLKTGLKLDVILPVELSKTSGSSRNVSIAADASSMASDLRNKDTEYCVTCSKILRYRKDSEPHDVCMCTGNPNFNISYEKVQMGEVHTYGTNVKECSTAEGDGRDHVCAVCKQPGHLLRCEGKGCERNFHLFCLDPPLEDFPPGPWFCHACTRMKMKLGIYSVSPGIESIWDVKDGLLNCKDYLVKYKCLAHVHNLWVPESQLLIDAPVILSKFQMEHQKAKVLSWKKEWTEPNRVLLKRFLPPLELSEENMSDSLNCSYEWLVKWKCLGYEHSTWEFENSLALSTHEAIALMEDYRRRHENAKRIDPSSTNEAKKNTFCKLLHFPKGFPRLDEDHLNTVNALGEFWQKSQSVVLIDEKERITKLILFLLAIRSQIYQPFLIITSLDNLPLWEDEFVRLAPSINAVVYNGNQDVRKIIRTLEFFSEDGGVMFEVLLSHFDAVLEDFEALNCIGWEAIAFCDCTDSKLSKHLEHVRRFNCSFLLLFHNGPLKDNIVEHLTAGGMFIILKEQLARHMAHERKSDSSRFVEYWVPVKLSEVQLEQYCATLVSNSMILCSCLRVDHVGALRDILVSTRKCCDHPYLVDQKLQASLIKGLEMSEYLNVGVKASGKLHLLERILHEMKVCSLRALILFQSVAGSMSIGDILDDFLRQRFGVDSYERIDKGLMLSKKLAALQKFNSKDNGRFVLLIENRACLPSIKLSSLDCVIIYDGDWNPLNDLKALQKINIDSNSENVKVFRLYSSHTVEEKILSYAKRDTFLDSNIQNVSASLTHSLISWGAAYLFGKLDELHQSDDKKPQSDVDSDGYLNAVVSEFLALLSNEDKDGTCVHCSILVKALQNGTSYSRNAMLSGEEEDGVSTSEIDPPTFWSNLLNERSPNWKYISGTSQRSRRRVQNIDESSKEENDEARKKRRKVSNMDAHASPSHVWFPDGRIDGESQKDNGLPPKKSPIHSLRQAHASLNETSPDDSYNSKAHEVPSSHGELEKQPSDINSDSLMKIRTSQMSLHLLLKPDLSKLCNILSLSEEVKHMSEKFLEYIMNNLMVRAEPEPLLQALKIALCWRAASLLKQKVDFGESLALAQKYLNYECSVEQALSIYEKLRVLKKHFPIGVDASTNPVDPNPLVNQLSSQIKETSVVPDYENCEKYKVASPEQELPCRHIDPESTKWSKLEEHRILADGKDKYSSREGVIEIATTHEASEIQMATVVISSGISNEDRTAMSQSEFFEVASEEDKRANQVHISTFPGEANEIIPMNESDSQGSKPPLPDRAEHLYLIDAPGNESQLPASENQVLSTGENETSIPTEMQSSQQMVDSSQPSSIKAEPFEADHDQYPEPLSVEESAPELSSTSGNQELLCDQTRFDNDPNPGPLSIGDYMQELNAPTSGDQGQLCDQGETLISQPILGAEQNLEPCPRILESSPCDFPVGNIRQESSQLGTRTSVEEDSGSHFMQLFPLPSLQVPYAHDPLQNELMRLSLQEDSLNKRHGEKICQLNLERDLELEKVRLKYTSLTNEVDKEFLKCKATLRKISDTVRLNQELADQFKKIFLQPPARTPVVPHGGQQSGTSTHGILPQAPQRSQATLPPMPPVHLRHYIPPMHIPRHGTAGPLSLPRSNYSAIGLTPTQLPSSLPLPRFTHSPRSLVSSSAPTRPPLSFPNSSWRPPFPPNRAPFHNVFFGGESRAPAPHLQRFRPPGSALHPRSYIVPDFSPPVPNTHPRAPSEPACPLNSTPTPTHLTDAVPQVGRGGPSLVADTGVVCLSDDE